MASSIFGASDGDCEPACSGLTSSMLGPDGKVKTCKWCGRSADEVAWTRGGNGLECKSDAAWIKYHFKTPTEKKDLLEKVRRAFVYLAAPSEHDAGLGVVRPSGLA